MVGREELPPVVRARIAWLRRGFLGILASLAVYLFDMQVVRTEEYRAAAETNSMRRVAVRAPRGLLLDREGRVLVKNRPAFNAVLLPDRVENLRTTLERARTALALDAASVHRLARRLRGKDHPEVLAKEDLSLAEVAALEARAFEWPEFRVREGLVRSYPHGSAAAHAFGHMGEIGEDQLALAEFRAYAPGEVVGQSGIEAKFEHYLRGRDGYRRVLVNSRGREIRELDGIEPPVPGLDVRLALDLDVQETAERAFGDLHGAAVAVDSRTGEVLALVSRPAYDPNAFAGKLSGDEWQKVHSDPAHPLFDRALLGRLPPGSVFKIVDSVAGLEERVWDPDQPITCTGQTVLHGDVFHCWKKEGHGTVSFHEALRGSCNVYFYHRGDAVGIERLAKWAHRLGLGEKTGIDIDPEGKGLIPDPAWKRRTKGEPWWPGETVSVAIGQGAVTVSVLQVASMMEVIANGGRAWVPYLVSSVGSGEYRRAPLPARDVPLRPDTLGRLRKGLWAVVNEAHGTGGKARIEGFDVTGKTGTAQAPSSDALADTREHAWFVGYAPGTDPVAVVAVFVEHGGHGGEAAAPIAGAVLARILEKKGLKPAGAAVAQGLPREDLVGPPAPVAPLVLAASAVAAAEPVAGGSLPAGSATVPPRAAAPPSDSPAARASVDAASAASPVPRASSALARSFLGPPRPRRASDVTVASAHPGIRLAPAPGPASVSEEAEPMPAGVPEAERPAAKATSVRATAKTAASGAAKNTLRGAAKKAKKAKRTKSAPKRKAAKKTRAVNEASR